MSFVGGKLKLKGGSDLPGIKKKKKKGGSEGAGKALALADSGDLDATAKADTADDIKKQLHGYALESRTETDDRRTKAEKKYESHMKKLEEEQLRKLALKSHRERIKDFNDKLANLSEHHDIPKVGPG